jgi:hypothetical protein
MSANRAVVVDPGRLAIRPVRDPATDRGKAVVRVRAVSLNVSVCPAQGADPRADARYGTRIRGRR